ncbi:MAG: Rho termination factor N-terminal domain-containing protein [Geminicoccaceae bacterium]
MAGQHGPTIKDDATYEALRDEGATKEKAARIANAQANPKQHPSRKGGRSPVYEEWTKRQLLRRARELEVEGRSRMSKAELIDALRDR